MKRTTSSSSGGFSPEDAAAFDIDTPHLPAAWEYIYQNRRILLRVDQRGPIFAQAEPPSDILLFRREAFQPSSSWLVWLRSPDLAGGGFCNFWTPAGGGADPRAVPERFHLRYAPSAATYTVCHDGLRCVSELSVPPDRPAVCLSVTVTNQRTRPLALSLFPVFRPYANPAQLAPWDRPEWYLKTALQRDGSIGFCTRLSNMNSEPDKRRTVVLWSSRAGALRAETSYERFVGHGSFEQPQSVHEGRLRLDVAQAGAWGVFNDATTVYGYPPVHALQYGFVLQPGETRSIRQVLAMLPPDPRGALPGVAEARRAARLTRAADQRTARRQTAERYRQLMAARHVETGDTAFDRYVNAWLPLQLDWVCSLDRGWPSGMRGSRDSANDFTAMVPLDAPRCRQILATVLSCQQRDGWFPRQYSAQGREGHHDLRGHVDGGVWVIELLHEYLCWSKDWALLEERLPWLDDETSATVLDHALAAIEYFLRKEHIGEHGLCKLGEGDWLDSVNRAGLRGRGESVTVTSQTVIALTQMAEILSALEASGRRDPAFVRPLLRRHARAAEGFRRNLRQHALNPAGFFNGFFNDEGRWLFSDRDPDGRRRPYGPANWFAVAAGVATPAHADAVFAILDELKCDDGYRVYWPPMGEPPITGVGRVGTGDQGAGLWENGNVYNQGSQGFLGRALAVAGRGDDLLDVLKWMLPYDQTRHPTATALTPPYALVNCWQGMPLFRRRGGLAFLTGSIAYALRLVHRWMLGVRPTPTGLAIDPCLPAVWPKVVADFSYLGRRVRLTILNPSGCGVGVRSATLNGRPVAARAIDLFSRRAAPVADDRLFDRPVNAFDVVMGSDSTRSKARNV